MRGKWIQLVNILGREGADSITVGMFYVAVLQAVFLFGSKTWVLIPWLEKSLEGFHYRAVRQMASMVSKLQRDGT